MTEKYRNNPDRHGADGGAVFLLALVSIIGLLALAVWLVLT
jgi:hypothetical protein